MDKHSGSIAYNRLDMQVSQVFHLAIELYDKYDYLLVLDHEDDITVFDDQSLHDSVSFYQMKTSNNSISLSMAINEGWIEKLYSHMYMPDILVKELGLITNCPFKLDKKTLSTDRTPFTDFGKEHIQKIKSAIATHRNIQIDDVDLSKMIHMRTTLSIDAHQRIVESEANDFLSVRFSQIKVQVVKTIVAAVFDILRRCQSYERLPIDAPHEKVANTKGFSRNTFNRIIKAAMKVNIPEFRYLVEVSKIPDEQKERAALAYTSVLADSNGNVGSFIDVFESLEHIVMGNALMGGETLWEYSCRCKDKLLHQKKRMAVVYKDDYYIEILTICIYLTGDELHDN